MAADHITLFKGTAGISDINNEREFFICHFISPYNQSIYHDAVQLTSKVSPPNWAACIAQYLSANSWFDISASHSLHMVSINPSSMQFTAHSKITDFPLMITSLEFVILVSPWPEPQLILSLLYIGQYALSIGKIQNLEKNEIPEKLESQFQIERIKYQNYHTLWICFKPYLLHHHV